MKKMRVCGFFCSSGCKEEMVYFRVDYDEDEELDLTQKHMSLRCPNCGKTGEQTIRSWDITTNLVKCSDIPDYTEELRTRAVT